MSFQYGFKKPNHDYETWHANEPLTLDDYREMVGGHIEVVPLGEGVIGVINEEGKLRNMQPNFDIAGGDVIVGNCVFVSSGHEDLEPLTDYQDDLLRWTFEHT